MNKPLPSARALVVSGRSGQQRPIDVTATDPLVLEGADLHDAIVMAARNVLESEIENRRIASTWFLYALFGPGHALGMKPLSIAEVERAVKRIWGEKHYDAELTYNLKSVLVDILIGHKAPDFDLIRYRKAL